MRNAKVARHRLTDEQAMALSGTIGLQMVDEPGESVAATLERVFGNLARAREAWRVHGARLMAENFTPGERLPAWWLLEFGLEPPPVELQAVSLRRMGALSRAEEQQLEEWRRMRETPAPIPVDVGIDHPTVITILEAAHDDESPQADAGNGTPEVSRGLGEASAADARAPESTGDAGAPDLAPDPPEQSTAAPEPIVTPQIIPWPQQPRRRPPEIEGWDTHDA